MNQSNSKSIQLPLDEAELDFLDEFLLNRLDDDVDTDDKDVGVYDIATLDGLFTAIVSGPVTLVPSQWLPSLWGDFPHTWDSKEEFDAVVALLIRHMNSISRILMEQPEYFEPIFYTREVAGETYTIVDEWCEGYQRGVALAENDWLEGGNVVTILLTPILAFTKSKNWAAHEFSDDEVANLQSAVVVNTRELHAFWLARRTSAAGSQTPRRRSEPRIGRNEPCPCGSGKKYKQCCLH